MKKSIGKWKLCVLIGVILLLNTANVIASSSEFFTVTNVPELLKAIGSNRTVLLMPGSYHLFEYSDLENPYIEWEKVSDGSQLIIRNVVNLSLVGDSAHVMATPQSGAVIVFRDSINVQIQGLHLGYQPIGDAHGAVLELERCNEIKVGGANLYGAGSYGIILKNVYDFKLSQSTIVDGLVGIAQITDSQDIHFTNNTLLNNKGGLEITKTKNVLIKDSEFLGNEIGNGTFLQMVESEVMIKDTKIAKNHGKYFYEYEGCVVVQDCTLEENTFTEKFRVVLKDELYEGVTKGSIAKVKYAIDNGLDVNTTDQQGFTPLCYAAALSEHPKMIQVLVENGAKVNGMYNNFSPLILAASMNPNPEITLALIEAGAEVDKTNQLGGTALIYAAKNGQYPVNISMLIQNGADVNHRLDDDTTPLMFAAESNDNPAIIEALIGLGAKVNAQNLTGRTALMYAIIKRNTPEVIQTLLENGANPTIEDRYGVDGFEYARMYKELRETKVWEMIQNWGKEDVEGTDGVDGGDIATVTDDTADFDTADSTVAEDGVIDSNTIDN